MDVGLLHVLSHRGNPRCLAASTARNLRSRSTRWARKYYRLALPVRLLVVALATRLIRKLPSGFPGRSTVAEWARMHAVRHGGGCAGG